MIWDQLSLDQFAYVFLISLFDFISFNWYHPQYLFNVFHFSSKDFLFWLLSRKINPNCMNWNFYNLLNSCIYRLQCYWQPVYWAFEAKVRNIVFLNKCIRNRKFQFIVSVIIYIPFNWCESIWKSLKNGNATSGENWKRGKRHARSWDRSQSNVKKKINEQDSRNHMHFILTGVILCFKLTGVIYLFA